MSLLSILRSGVKQVNTITKSLQADISYRRCLSIDYRGKKTLDSPVILKALVDWSEASVRSSTGELTVSRAQVTFLDITALTNATAGKGIDDNDEIVLPDGTTGPILDLRGFIDAGTTNPLATLVLLG